MSLIATQKIATAGTAVTFAAAANGDTADTGAGVTLVVKNGSGSSMNVTITLPGSNFAGVANPATVIAVAASAETYIPMDTRYADTNGKADIAYSSLTTITRAVISR